MRIIDISTLNDTQITEIAKELGWKATDPKKIRNLLSLNMKSAKVGSAIQAEYEKAEQVEECLDALAGVNMPNPLNAGHGAPFGMDEQAAAKYIVETFGLVPRMAKRAIDRAIVRDEYHGRGYVVKVIDIQPGVIDDFNIMTFSIMVYAA